MTDSLLHFWGNIVCFVYFPGNLCPQYVRQLTIWFLHRFGFPLTPFNLQHVDFLSRNAPSFAENIVAEDFCALSPRRTKQWVCAIWKVDQGNLMQTLVHSNVHVCTTTEYGYFSCVQCNYSIQYHQCDPMDLTYVLQQCVGCSALLQWPHMLALTGGHVALPMDRVDPKYQSRDNCSTCHFHAFHTVYI